MIFLIAIYDLLFNVKGQFCSNCGIGCCLDSNCLRKANLTHKCKEVAAVASGQEVIQNTDSAKNANTKDEGKC